MQDNERDRQGKERYNREVQELRRSVGGELGEFINRNLDRISKEHIFLSGTNAGSNIPGVFGFYLEEFTDGVEGDTVLIPTIVINTDTFFHVPSPVLQADLVKVLSILDQYPFNGYERRLTDVYSDALTVQRKWVQQVGESDAVPYPPEDFDDEDKQEFDEGIIKYFLGEEHYYCDAGFDDFLDVINELERARTYDATILSILKKDKRTFIGVRHKYAEIFYQNTHQENKDTPKEENRRKFILEIIDIMVSAAHGKQN